ncbi:MAG: hypothetical protein PVG22_03610 [Chromatiales bacterium]
METHPGSLRQWAEGLPFANPEQMAQAVITSLSRLNRFPAPVKRRQELMEIYQTPCERLRRLSQESKPPIPIRLQRQVMQEMAYGYLHLVNHRFTARPSVKHRKELHGHIYHAVKYLGQEYLDACLMYDCHGSKTLQELIRLHTLAEENGLQHTPVEDPEYLSASISQQTKLTLLLSLLDPCHLQENEPRIVFDYLGEFADTAAFAELTRDLDPAGHYVIDRMGELPPQRFDPSMQEGLATPRFCLFNILPVSQQLHRDLRAIEKQETGIPTGLQQLGVKSAANLLRRMLKSWHIRLQRNSERHATSGQAKLSLGLLAIHRFFSDPISTMERNSGYQEVIDLALETGGLTPHLDRNLQTLDCWRCNQSRSGVALHLSIPQAVMPQVGDLVLLTKPENPSRNEAKVGIIRRALIHEQTVLEIGVEFINGRLVPLTIQPIGTNEVQTGPAYPALYIDMGEIERSSLLVTKDTLAIDQEYRIEEMIPAPTVSPILQTEATSAFERFRIKRV